MRGKNLITGLLRTNYDRDKGNVDLVRNGNLFITMYHKYYKIKRHQKTFDYTLTTCHLSNNYQKHFQMVISLKPLYVR